MVWDWRERREILEMVCRAMGPCFERSSSWIMRAVARWYRVRSCVVVLVTAVRARAREWDCVRRVDCRVRTLGRRVGIWRCRKEAFVVGERIRERERAVLWRLVLRRALSCGRWVGRE